MKQIKKRRKRLRIGNPVGFSLFCVLCLAVLAGLYLGVSWCVAHGPAVMQAVKQAVRQEVSATATAEPADSPSVTATPEAQALVPSVADTPALGTPDTSTPTAEPAVVVTPGPTANASQPLYGQIVALDPCRDGKSKYTAEAEYNLLFANRLKTYLESKGATVILTRENSSDYFSNADRASAVKAAESTLAIRLMCNHISSSTSACYVQASSANKTFGQSLIDSYVAATGMSRQSGNDKKQGLETKSDEVAKSCGCTCALLVMGNWDNKTDRSNLQDEAFMDKMIEGVYNAIVAYYGVIG